MFYYTFLKGKLLENKAYNVLKSNLKIWEDWWMQIRLNIIVLEFLIYYTFK